MSMASSIQICGYLNDDIISDGSSSYLKLRRTHALASVELLNKLSQLLIISVYKIITWINHILNLYITYKIGTIAYKTFQHPDMLPIYFQPHIYMKIID